MSDFRFHLKKCSGRTKLDCPQCGRYRCFVPYIDDTAKVQFPDNVGKCDHEHRCGYHYSPKDYFREHPETWHADDDIRCQTPVQVSPSECRTPSYITAELMERSMSHYDINPLFTFLSKVFGTEKTLVLMSRYNVGTARIWGGSAVFWQVDSEGHIRGGKIMGFNPDTGHRIKEPVPLVCWVHAVMKIEDYHLVQCLFGEHLLKSRPYSHVAVVESEKTALIASGFVPEMLWLATGGKNGCFNGRALQVLKGRSVTLYPDLGAADEWRCKAVNCLAGICARVTVSDLLENNATPEQRSRGLDIADFLLMEPTKQQMLQSMKRSNPHLTTLIETFDLVLEE